LLAGSRDGIRISAIYLVHSCGVIAHEARCIPNVDRTHKIEVLYCTLLYCTLLYCTFLYCTAFCCAVLTEVYCT